MFNECCVPAGHVRITNFTTEWAATHKVLVFSQMDKLRLLGIIHKNSYGTQALEYVVISKPAWKAWVEYVRANCYPEDKYDQPSVCGAEKVRGNLEESSVKT